MFTAKIDSGPATALIARCFTNKHGVRFSLKHLQKIQIEIISPDFIGRGVKGKKVTGTVRNFGVGKGGNEFFYLLFHEAILTEV